MNKPPEKKAPPMKYLLETSNFGVGSFELAKLGEAADLRSEMLATLENLRREMVSMFDGIIERAKEQIRNQEGMFDRLVDETAQAALAAMLRRIDRQELVRQLLESSTVTLDAIMAEARAEIRNQGRSEEEAEDYGKMPNPWLVRSRMTAEEAKQARKDSRRRCRERHIAKGMCEKCPEPLDRNSVRYCTKHLAWKREQDRKDREKKGVQIGTHGRQPGTLASLAMHGAISREKKTRALLAKLGIKPEHAAVSLNAAKEALLKVIRDEAHAMTQAELFEKAGVITKTTGQKALKALLAQKKVQRIGAGGVREPYRHFLDGGDE